MPHRAGPGRAHLSLAALALASLLGLAPSVAAAQGERVIFGAEGALLVPTTSPSTSALAPGATLSLAAQFSVTNWLMPLVRARAAALGAGGQQHDPTGMASFLGGVRFRPRGIAHPEEPSRAACVWAEIDAGLTLFGARAQPTFEAAVGFLFLAGAADIGPALRFVHVMPASSGDGPDVFMVTVGLEVLLGDAR